MLFTPDKGFKILTDSQFKSSIGSITEALSSCRTEGFFKTADGLQLYYEYFLCEGATASVIIVHGLSEFTKKYYEVAYYLLNEGYNVFIFDQRCHGLSDRLTDEPDLIHVDRFEDYVADLKIFTDEIVLKASPLPIYIYSHSMGSAITAMYLSKNRDTVKKAVLSAPMFAPYTDKMPQPIARSGMRLKSVFMGKKSKFKPSQRFNPEAAEKNCTDIGKNRFMHNLGLRRTEPRYQSTPMTTCWVLRALCLTRDFKRNKTAEKISAKMLLISAENDTSVRNDFQLKFAQKTDCKMLALKGATHSILTGSDEQIAEYLTAVFDFYRD